MQTRYSWWVQVTTGSKIEWAMRRQDYGKGIDIPSPSYKVQQ